MNKQNNLQIGDNNKNQQFDGAYLLGRYEKSKLKEPWFKKEIVKIILWVVGTLIVAGILAYFGLRN